MIYWEVSCARRTIWISWATRAEMSAERPEDEQISLYLASTVRIVKGAEPSVKRRSIGDNRPDSARIHQVM